jgi:type I restriction enzyme M protein
VLGSQGDAGQFRTPRHIIDFIVEVIDPKKNETVLDPACGTAGFLISAYKHILKANSEPIIMHGASAKSTIHNPQSTINLTPDEKGRLAQNFKGYDISPDMVRLSLVNLYLHGFADPHIHEYDALTSQDRWNEYADVILANPPFMSPKGGIKPHNRFSVQSKRSEVLFVDYMAEHLKSNGRAGIIVPEGIIFQGQTAYKQLRKMLVEEYLVAVVSLPAGVFNPYSGVKTSILILDKSLAKQSDTIAFFKIENDGFGLGAQRREIDKNDLPAAADFLKSRLHSIPSASSTLSTPNALIVDKAKIAANGDYNLSGERYREGGPQSTNYPWHKIESLVKTVTPPVKIQKTSFGESGRFPIIDQSQEDIAGWTDDESALIRPSKPLVIFGDHTCAVKLIETPFAQGADGIKILRTVDTLDPRFLYYLLRTKPLESSGYQRHFSKLKEYEIPLPPLAVQKEIVAEIEGYQKVIDGARAVLDNYRPHIPIRPDWPMVELGEVMERYNEIIHPGDRKPGELTFVGMEHIEEGTGQRIGSTTVDLGRMTGRKPLFKKGQIVYGYLRPYLNKVWIAEFDGCSSVDQFAFEVNTERAEPKFVATFLRSDSFLSQSGRSTTRAQLPRISIGEVLAAKIPLPLLETQRAIVAEIEAEQALVAANRELIARFEKKIQATLARVWGEDGQPGG